MYLEDSVEYKWLLVERDRDGFEGAGKWYGIKQMEEEGDVECVLLVTFMSDLYEGFTWRDKERVIKGEVVEKEVVGVVNDGVEWNVD